jgi:hypothetical protein
VDSGLVALRTPSGGTTLSTTSLFCCGAVYDSPLPPDHSWFEVGIVDTGREKAAGARGHANIAIGLAGRLAHLSSPGLADGSIGVDLSEYSILADGIRKQVRNEAVAVVQR